MGGLFMPDDYVAMSPSPLEMNIASLVWGISLGFAIFTFSKGTRQSYGVWRRKGSINAYIAMIWVEWIVCFIISIICWFNLWGTIPPSFGMFFSIITLWVFQTQCIIQIIINRIALLVRNKTFIRRLKWGTIILMSLINISVYCIWIPAQLQVSSTFVHINAIWDRLEKAIFAVIDATLNIYFIYLVRSKLIANGLSKYNCLFYFNIAMICTSLALDVILIGVMSLGQGFIYVQFHPLVYGIKLHIEMNLADLIAKTVRGEHGSGNNASGSDPGGYYHHSGSNQTQQRHGPRSRKNAAAGVGISSNKNRGTASVCMQTLISGNHDVERNGIADVLEGQNTKGIHRTVETRVVHEAREDDSASRTSSTEQLQKKFGIV